MSPRHIGAAALLAVATALLMASCDHNSYVDECGNRHEGRKSTVIGVNAATGDVLWTVRPAEDDFVLIRASDNEVRVPTNSAGSETVLDVRTGEVVATPAASQPAIAYNVPSGDPRDADPADLAATVDGEVQTAVVNAADLAIRTDVWTTSDDLHLLANSPTGQAWSITLAPKDGWGGVTRPLVFGDIVVVSVRDKHPADRFCA